MMTDIISQLEAERSRIDQAIAILRGHGANGVELKLPPLQVKSSKSSRQPIGAPIARSLTKSRATKPSRTPNAKSENGGGSDAAKLRAVVANVSEPFDANECVALLGADGDPGKVRACLSYWAKTGQLKVVEAGAPGHPSKFERTAKFQPISGVKA